VAGFACHKKGEGKIKKRALPAYKKTLLSFGKKKVRQRKPIPAAKGRWGKTCGTNLKNRHITSWR
jgi:hypothetical protein